MKTFLGWILLSSTLLSRVFAEGPRGAAERILYYYAYLAEEITVPDEDDRNIGAGCPGSLAGSRCTFNKFCEYIWKAKKGQSITRPAVTVLGAGEDFTKVPISNLYNRILTWEDPVSRFGITGAVDANRVFLDASNWYDMLSRVADSLGDLGGMDLSGDARQALANTIITDGKEAANLVHDMRFQDMEKFRKKAVAKKLGLTVPDLQLKPGRNTLNIPGNWETIDAPGTIIKLQGSHPNIATELGTAIHEWQTGSAAAVGHWSAVCSADAAQRLAGC
ncbi:hypothetical protein NA57DRAFT_80438 [Rhizodiscina lignyota]|uniref:Uncharacterized protein n=1 Tax=Rhizodiscina lignyota TaxID=1504668 RepID=A0A9P4I458_9PEZI|nr:hypothetical protein NA57DRAFT_80438 [Rhizodiscina lignyota]